MAVGINYRFTNHLMERFVERNNRKYIHLNRCRVSGCMTCNNLVYELKEEVRENKREITRQLTEAVYSATDERSFLNNTEFMSHYYERYGFDHRFTFLLKDDLIYVVVSKDGSNVVVTCVVAKGHVTAGTTMRPKFKKKVVI